MTGLVDIHAHILPGIDDGPEGLADSLAMLGAAAEVGISTIAATPHLRADFPGVHAAELGERCQALREAASERGIPIAIVAGAEVSLTWALDADEEQLAQASYGQRGSDLLLETPTLNAGAIELALSRLAARGYRVTLAHPERGTAFQRNPAKLRPLVERGLLLAINAESLLGPRGSPHRRAARRLCLEGLAHAIVSDGHRAAHWRPVTVLAPGVEAAAALVGVERAGWMAREAPAAILEGRPLGDGPPVERRGRRRLFGISLPKR